MHPGFFHLWEARPAAQHVACYVVHCREFSPHHHRWTTSLNKETGRRNIADHRVLCPTYDGSPIHNWYRYRHRDIHCPYISIWALRSRKAWKIGLQRALICRCWNRDCVLVRLWYEFQGWSDCLEAADRLPDCLCLGEDKCTFCRHEYRW